MFRALTYDFAQGASTSTITEHVAKVLYLGGNDHNPWGRLEDAAVARKLESRYTKPEILAAYLNIAHLDENAYGIEAASERFVGIAPQRLDAAQASLLAGLIQAPSHEPLGMARASRAEAPRSLVRNGFPGVDRATSTLARPLRLRTGATPPPLRGVELPRGPAFVWRQLLLGAGIVLIAAVGLVAGDLRPRLPRGGPAARLFLLLALVVGAA